MTHAMFGFDGDIVPTFDTFARRQIHRIPLHNLLGQVLRRVALCGGTDSREIATAQDLDVDGAYSSREYRHRPLCRVAAIGRKKLSAAEAEAEKSVGRCDWLLVFSENVPKIRG